MKSWQTERKELIRSVGNSCENCGEGPPFVVSKKDRMVLCKLCRKANNAGTLYQRDPMFHRFMSAWLAS